MNAPLYTTEILRLAASLGDGEPIAASDGTAERRSPTCGSRVRTEVAVDDEGRVAAIAQQVEACAFGQASAALVARSAPGRSAADIAAARAEFAEWLGGRREEPGAWPGLGALAPARTKRVRHGAMLLPFDALISALEAAKDGRA